MDPSELRTDDFDYTLPLELIAQDPAARRDESRLMVLDRATGNIRHDRFAAIGHYLDPGDVLIANRSRVIPARLKARKATGGEVELLLVRPSSDNRWTALARPSRRLRPGLTLTFDNSTMRAKLEAALGEGLWLLQLQSDNPDAEIHRIGELPLPPYIQHSSAGPDRYQTVYADQEGSVAAPTAGLHFTPELLAQLRSDDIATHFVTLHVGLGTFKPVTAETVKEHTMHAEWAELPEEVASAANRAREGNHRVVAVGTTSTRLLESAAAHGKVQPFRDETSMFIYPGYRFRVVDALVTNFHLPRSTLLMLVSAFAGRELILEAYAEAIRERYRFYSFGDAMLIL